MPDPRQPGPVTRARAAARWLAVRRWLILVVVAFTCALVVVDWGGTPRDTLRVGQVAPRTVRAPYSFTWQDLAGWDAARAAAGEAVPPVIVLDPSVRTRAVERVQVAFRDARGVIDAAEPRQLTEARSAALTGFVAALSLDLPTRRLAALAAADFSEEVEATVARWLVDATGDRVVVPDRVDLPARGERVRVVMRATDPQTPDTSTDRVVDERFVTPDELRDRVMVTSVQDPPQAWTSAAQAVAVALVTPDATPDPARTEAARRAAESGVLPEPLLVQRGETLFREGDRLTARDVARYEALQRSRSDRGPLLQVLATTAFLLLVLGALAQDRRRRGPRIPDDIRELGAVGLLIVITAVLAKVVVAAAPGVTAAIGNDATPESVWYLAPVAGGAMLVRILMGPRRAMFYAAAAASVCGLIMRLDALLVVYFLLVGVVAASKVETVVERLAILRAGAFSGAVGALAVIVLHFVRLYAGDGEVSLATTIAPLWSMLAAVTGGVMSGFLVLALVPLFEVLGFVTDHRMLELASLNHPLLRQLMLRAPGTYHHSVIVGTLAEAGCEAIGANSLQAKIASYFHDIGKSVKPRYFVENQRGGANPHTELPPGESAAILIGHVVEGARLAREHKLPRPIIDNILMHHGTGLIQYFYGRAREQADRPGDVDEAAFRYPGPKPSTREAGVIMLADKAEAATRTIRQPTEQNIRAMIQRIVTSTLEDGQLTSCPLTFQEIHLVTETFVGVLVGIHHQRIEYAETRAISQAPAEPVSLPDVEVVHNVVELDPVAMNPAARWSADDLTDETTDYESLRNLPHGGGR